mgnify:CR=1 FL=1
MKPQGKPTLAPEDDKRPAMVLQRVSAEEAFGGDNTSQCYGLPLVQDRFIISCFYQFCKRRVSVGFFPVERVHLHVVQPRIPNTSSWSTTLKEANAASASDICL